ncbi:pisatin demethylase [Fonsecaea pedrosoi]|nr:pisatin demethylase [Fonsecaea pedrosoi]
MLEAPVSSIRVLFSWEWFPVWILVAGTCLGLYRLTLHPLSTFPGPFWAKITGLWRSRRYFAGTWHEDILALHRNYGRVVRVAPNELSIVDENAMKLLYGHGHNSTKTAWYQVWEMPDVAPGLFATQDKNIHSFLRKRVSSAYSMTSILRYEPYIQGMLNLLFSKLAAHSRAGRSVNMSDFTNALAFDVVGELAYSEPMGHLETETDVMDLRKIIFNGFFVMGNLGHAWGQMIWFNNPIMRLAMKLKPQVQSFDAFQQWSAMRVKERLDNLGDTKRYDMLTHFVGMKGADGGSASFGEVLIEAMNIIGAGADTTSIGMRTCLYYICTRPEVFKKVQQEVDAFYETRESAAPISYLETQTLPYLQAVVREALRMLPSIVWQLLRHAPVGLVVDGKEIPAGTIVGISPLAQNRDPAIWGDDADEFRPERWLESEDRSRYLESRNMTFGGNGPRMCIGRNIALIVRNFDAEFVDPQNPWKISTTWFAYQKDMHMRFKLRPHTRI